MMALVPLCITLIGGCSHFRPALGVRSLVTDAAFFPTLPVAVYVPSDQNTADLYLSDIPASRLADPSDNLDGVSGNIIHVHVFLMPEAGLTPIDDSACNLTVRHLILTGGIASEAADGQTPAEGVRTGGIGRGVGLYAGGGFCLPSSSPGDSVFAASILDAKMRLVKCGPGFADRLESASMSGELETIRDDRTARAISERMDSLTRGLPETVR